eukprot:5396214-Amphidinium_carterae.3
MAMYIEVEGAFSDSSDDAFKSKVDSTVLLASITKIIAGLMQMYVQSTTTSELRPAIQKEIKALRGFGLKEKEVLPKALLLKVQATSSMRA